jgi:hypothetical protein
VEGLPSINNFSDSEYENYTYHFSSIESAVYLCGSQKESIDINDSRLIRLLNFLAYSEESGYSSWLQGYVEESEISQYQECKSPMLEIVFDNSTRTDDHVFSTTPKMLICGHTCLLFVDTERPEWPLEKGVYADQLFPYFELLEEMVISGELEDAVLYQNEWGGNNWIDLLAYAGF